MEDLIHLLTHTPPGTIRDTYLLERLLSKCWGQLHGSSDQRMAPYKLLRRMEQVKWRPPLLTFAVERHETPGSTNTKVEHWVVDLHNNTASISRSDQRTLCPLSPADTPETAAKEIAQSILSRSPDRRLKWEEGSVCVMATWSCPSTSPASGTLGIRRKRLCRCIRQAIRPHGWRHIGGTWFKRIVAKRRRSEHAQ